jgi:hypothetical protein
MLWTLLAATSSPTILSGAIGETHAFSGGLAAYFTAVIVGGLLCVANFLMIERLANAVDYHYKRALERAGLWMLRCAYQGLAMCCPLAAAIGAWPARLLLQIA